MVSQGFFGRITCSEWKEKDTDAEVNGAELLVKEKGLMNASAGNASPGWEKTMGKKAENAKPEVDPFYASPHFIKCWGFP